MSSDLEEDAEAEIGKRVVKIHMQKICEAKTIYYFIN